MNPPAIFFGHFRLGVRADAISQGDFEKHVKLIFADPPGTRMCISRICVMLKLSPDRLNENVDRRAGTDCTRCRLQTEGRGYRFQRGMHEHCGMYIMPDRAGVRTSLIP